MAIVVPGGVLQGIQRWSAPTGEHSCGLLQRERSTSAGHAPDAFYQYDFW